MPTNVNGSDFGFWDGWNAVKIETARLHDEAEYEGLTRSDDLHGTLLFNFGGGRTVKDATRGGEIGRPQGTVYLLTRGIAKGREVPDTCVQTYQGLSFGFLAGRFFRRLVKGDWFRDFHTARIDESKFPKALPSAQPKTTFTPSPSSTSLEGDGESEISAHSPGSSTLQLIQQGDTSSSTSALPPGPAQQRRVPGTQSQRDLRKPAAPLEQRRSMSGLSQNVTEQQVADLVQDLKYPGPPSTPPSTPPTPTLPSQMPEETAFGFTEEEQTEREAEFMREQLQRREQAASTSSSSSTLEPPLEELESPVIVLSPEEEEARARAELNQPSTSSVSEPTIPMPETPLAGERKKFPEPSLPPPPISIVSDKKPTAKAEPPLAKNLTRTERRNRKGGPVPKPVTPGSVATPSGGSWAQVTGRPPVSPTSTPSSSSTAVPSEVRTEPQEVSEEAALVARLKQDFLCQNFKRKLDVLGTLPQTVTEDEVALWRAMDTYYKTVPQGLSEHETRELAKFGEGATLSEEGYQETAFATEEGIIGMDLVFRVKTPTSDNVGTYSIRKQVNVKTGEVTFEPHETILNPVIPKGIAQPGGPSESEQAELEAAEMTRQQQPSSLREALPPPSPQSSLLSPPSPQQTLEVVEEEEIEVQYVEPNVPEHHVDQRSEKEHRQLATSFYPGYVAVTPDQLREMEQREVQDTLASFSPPGSPLREEQEPEVEERPAPIAAPAYAEIREVRTREEIQGALGEKSLTNGLTAGFTLVVPGKDEEQRPAVTLEEGAQIIQRAFEDSPGNSQFGPAESPFGFVSQETVTDGVRFVAQDLSSPELYVGNAHEELARATGQPVTAKGQPQMSVRMGPGTITVKYKGEAEAGDRNYDWSSSATYHVADGRVEWSSPTYKVQRGAEASSSTPPLPKATVQGKGVFVPAEQTSQRSAARAVSLQHAETHLKNRPEGMFERLLGVVGDRKEADRRLVERRVESLITQAQATEGKVYHALESEARHMYLPRDSFVEYRVDQQNATANFEVGEQFVKMTVRGELMLTGKNPSGASGSGGPPPQKIPFERSMTVDLVTGAITESATWLQSFAPAQPLTADESQARAVEERAIVEALEAVCQERNDRPSVYSNTAVELTGLPEEGERLAYHLASPSPSGGMQVQRLLKGERGAAAMRQLFDEGRSWIGGAFGYGYAGDPATYEARIGAASRAMDHFFAPEHNGNAIREFVADVNRRTGKNYRADSSSYRAQQTVRVDGDELRGEVTCSFRMVDKDGQGITVVLNREGRVNVRDGNITFDPGRFSLPMVTSREPEEGQAVQALVREPRSGQAVRETASEALRALNDWQRTEDHYEQMQSLGIGRTIGNSMTNWKGKPLTHPEGVAIEVLSKGEGAEEFVGETTAFGDITQAIRDRFIPTFRSKPVQQDVIQTTAERIGPYVQKAISPQLNPALDTLRGTAFNMGYRVEEPVQRRVEIDMTQEDLKVIVRDRQEATLKSAVEGEPDLRVSILTTQEIFGHLTDPEVRWNTVYELRSEE